MRSAESRNRRPGPIEFTKAHVVLLLVAISLGFLLPAGWCAAFLPEGKLPGALAYHVSLTANLLIAILAYGSLAAFPVVLVTMLLSLIFRRRFRARRIGSWAFALVLAVVLMVPMLWISPAVYWPLHHKAVRAVPPRAQELVAAIERYKQERGAPPPQLDALVPGYTREIPGTGLAGFPRFEYHPLTDHGPYKGRYELSMPCPYSYWGPSALLNWPEENGYLVRWPEDAAWRWDGGDWVYVNMK